MLGLIGFIGGIFALVWSVVFASVGLALLFVFLVPFLILAVVFRIGIALVKLAVVFVLLCFVAAWMI